MGRGRDSSSSPSPSRGGRERERSHKSKGKDRDREKDRHRDRERFERERDRERFERDREREQRDRDRDRDRGRDRERERERDRDREREREWERDRDREREQRERERERAARERDRDRDRDSHRDRRRSRSRSRSPAKRKHDRSEKHDGPAAAAATAAAVAPAAAAAAAPSSTTPRDREERAKLAALGVKAEHAVDAYAGLSAEDAAKKRRDDEQAALEAEMEKRRKRVEEWRMKKGGQQADADQPPAVKQEDEGALPNQAPLGPAAVKQEPDQEAPSGQQLAGADADADAMQVDGLEDGLAGGRGGSNNKGWSLEDDDEDDEEGGLGYHGGDDDDVDPLDAFMAANQAGMDQQHQRPQRGRPPSRQQSAADGMDTDDADGAGAGADGIKQESEEEEVDPLDAFMAGQVAPQATRSLAPSKPAAGVVKKEEPMDEDDDLASAFDNLPSRSGAAGGAPSGAAAAASSAGPGPSSRAISGVSIASRGFLPRGVAGLPPGRGLSVVAAAKRKAQKRGLRAFGSDSEEESSSDEEEEEEEQDDAEWAKAVTTGKLSKGDKLAQVDHNKIDYAPFRKNFYIEVPELARLSEEDVTALRKELDGIKVRGANIPKPIRAWTQAGLSSKVIDVLKKSGFDKPLPIQAQALPIIMSGRDCIGIAKTGSGKTLAFVLPLLRHIKDQPPLAQGDGPIALILAPTRELVQQISKEVKKFAKPLGLECVPVFGGSGVANQISDLKRGTEVVSCTPGRMIDLLVTGGGKITNLRRVTYLVMDEADRMFDMGFEPQITRIVSNIRPDRQTILFSATFPRSVEMLARKILQDPVEILVGGRSVVNPDITQIVEIRPNADRFLRLLEILGEWYGQGKIIIFVQSQESCDNLFRDLLKYGYPCLSLHGGKDQSDRESTIADFKGAVCNILVATSVAARGLDVKDLVLVVNHDVPNHHEDYVHRVGRTGRAGNKGTAITFIGPDEERYAPDLVKALKESQQPVPEDLEALASSFNEKRKAGLVQGHGSGYGGQGFKFDRGEDEAFKQGRKAKAKEMGLEVADGGDESDESDDDIRQVNGPSSGATAAAAAPGAGAEAPTDTIAAAAAAAQVAVAAAAARQQQALANAQAAAQASAAAGPPAAAASAAAPGAGGPTSIQSMLATAQQVAARLLAQKGMPAPAAPAPSMAPPSLPGAADAATRAPITVAGGVPMGILPGGAGAPAAAAVPAAAPAAPVMNPMVAAALAALPGVTLAGQAAAAAAPAPAASAHVPPPLSGAMAPKDLTLNAISAASRAAALAAQFASKGKGGEAAAGAGAADGAAAPGRHFEAELEINDFPQHARWKVTHRDTFAMIAETTGCALITRGVFVPPGKAPPEGERKIYLIIEGPTDSAVKAAKQELKRVVEEATEKVMRRDAPSTGKYSIM